MPRQVKKTREEIDTEIRELRLKRKTLSNEEKRKKEERLAEVGRKAEKAGLSDLSTDELFGALLEIAEKKNSESCLKDWVKRAAEFCDQDSQKSTKPLIVAVRDTISSELKDSLKQEGLAWNKFRREWCGYADQEKVRLLLGHLDFDIEVVEER